MPNPTHARIASDNSGDNLSGGISCEPTEDGPFIAANYLSTTEVANTSESTVANPNP